MRRQPMRCCLPRRQFRAQSILQRLWPCSNRGAEALGRADQCGARSRDSGAACHAGGLAADQSGGDHIGHGPVEGGDAEGASGAPSGCKRIARPCRAWWRCRCCWRWRAGLVQTGFPAALVGPVALVLSAPFDTLLGLAYAALAMAFFQARQCTDPAGLRRWGGCPADQLPH